VQELKDGDTVKDVFTYTIKDADGDESPQQCLLPQQKRKQTGVNTKHPMAEHITITVSQNSPCGKNQTS